MTYYEPESSLNLDFCLDQYEQLRHEYWEHRPALTPFLELVDSIARAVIRGSAELVRPSATTQGGSAVDWKTIASIAAPESKGYPLVRERIEIEVAREFSLGTMGMAERCLDLTRILAAAQPNESVMRFLRRLSKCYIAGFQPECVVLCRAVLANAVTETFGRKKVPEPADSGGNSTMKMKVDAAHRFGWLSKNAADEAMMIWRRGSKAIHDDPEATRDVRATIAATTSVLTKLYSA
jgi:hypothetical protein